MSNKKFNLSFNLNFTTSKLLAYIVVASSIGLSIILKDPNTFTIGVTMGVILSGVKTASTSFLQNKTMNDYNNEQATYRRRKNNNDIEDNNSIKNPEIL